MTKDDTIRLAQEISGVSYPSGMAGVKIGMSHDHLERFAQSVAAAEREACAKVLDTMAENDRLSNYYRVAALAIRERGAP